MDITVYLPDELAAQACITEDGRTLVYDPEIEPGPIVHEIPSEGARAHDLGLWFGKDDNYATLCRELGLGVIVDL